HATADQTVCMRPCSATSHRAQPAPVHREYAPATTSDWWPKNTDPATNRYAPVPTLRRQTAVADAGTAQQYGGPARQWRYIAARRCGDPTAASFHADW